MIFRLHYPILVVYCYPCTSKSPNHNFGSQVKKLRERFGLSRVVLVGDRGMLTEARISEELRPGEGLEWISAVREPAIKKLRVSVLFNSHCSTKLTWLR